MAAVGSEFGIRDATERVPPEKNANVVCAFKPMRVDPKAASLRGRALECAGPAPLWVQSGRRRPHSKSSPRENANVVQVFAKSRSTCSSAQLSVGDVLPKVDKAELQHAPSPEPVFSRASPIFSEIFPRFAPPRRMTCCATKAAPRTARFASGQLRTGRPVRHGSSRKRRRWAKPPGLVGQRRGEHARRERPARASRGQAVGVARGSGLRRNGQQ